MKRIVSVSIGSSRRDSCVETEILGEKFIIERIGTDGNIKKALGLIKSLDGKVDALGMGGIDLYLWAGQHRYILRDAIPLKNAAKLTPIVDGSGLKDTLERIVIEYLAREKIIDFTNKTTLITSALDRFGMAEAIDSYRGDLIIGDLIFALGLDIPVYTLKHIHGIARWLAPLVCKLPFHILYPTGGSQDGRKHSKLGKYYERAHIIGGDFHYIKRYMPQTLGDKIIITNTVTKEDLQLLRERGVKLLITTTPLLGDRSFGTNAMEAMMVAIIKDGKYNTYEEVIKVLDLKPRIEYLQTQESL